MPAEKKTLVNNTSITSSKTYETEICTTPNHKFKQPKPRRTSTM